MRYPLLSISPTRMHGLVVQLAALGLEPCGREGTPIVRASVVHYRGLCCGSARRPGVTALGPRSPSLVLQASTATLVRCEGAPGAANVSTRSLRQTSAAPTPVRPPTGPLKHVPIRLLRSCSAKIESQGIFPGKPPPDLLNSNHVCPRYRRPPQGRQCTVLCSLYRTPISPYADTTWMLTSPTRSTRGHPCPS